MSGRMLQLLGGDVQESVLVRTPMRLGAPQRRLELIQHLWLCESLVRLVQRIKKTVFFFFLIFFSREWLIVIPATCHSSADASGPTQILLHFFLCEMIFMGPSCISDHARPPWFLSIILIARAFVCVLLSQAEPVPRAPVLFFIKSKHYCFGWTVLAMMRTASCE